MSVPSGDDEKNPRQLRYGIVEHEDLIRDLLYWETLTVSSMLLRPFEVIHNK